MGEEHRPRAFHRAWGLDLTRFFAQVDLIRAALPEEVKTANRILQERQRLLEEARAQASLLVGNDEIVRRATEQADEIVQRAHVEATELRRSAEEYATRALANLEDYVTRVLTAVRTARERLSAGPEPQVKE